MKPRTPSQEIKTRYQQALDYRKKYTLENSEYVENKRRDIELNDSDTLAELCFALVCGDKGFSWLWEDSVLDIIKLKTESKNINRKLEIGDLLDKLGSYPEIIDRLNIDIDKRAEYLNEVVNELTDVMPKTLSLLVDKEKPYKRITPTVYIYHIAGKLFNEMTLQINPEIKAKNQVRFVQGMFADYKLSNYHCEDTHNTHFKTVEQIDETKICHLY